MLLPRTTAPKSWENTSMHAQRFTTNRCANDTTQRGTVFPIVLTKQHIYQAKTLISTHKNSTKSTWTNTIMDDYHQGWHLPHHITSQYHNNEHLLLLLKYICHPSPPQSYHQHHQSQDLNLQRQFTRKHSNIIT